DPAEPLRRRARRRRRRLARVLRRDAAEPARRDRGRADPDDDRGAAQLRPDLHHDEGRARHEHDRARLGGLRPRVPDRPHRLGRRDRRHARLHDLRARVSDHPHRRAGDALIARRERLLNYAILIVFSAFALYPVVGVLTTALANPGTASGFSLSTDFHWANFSAAWDQGHFSHYLRSSAIVSVSVVTVSTLLSILSGYAFGLMRFRGATVLFYVFLLGLMVPVEAMVVPLYFDFRRVHLLDTYWALILPQIGLSVAFGTFWMRAFFLST